MIRVNLLPSELRKKKKAPFFDRTLLYVLVLLIGVGFLLWLQTTSQQKEISRLDDDIARVETEIQRYSQQIKMVEEARALRDKMKERMNAIQELDVQRPLMVKVFENFGGLVPDFVWIDEYREVEKYVTVVGFSYNLKGIANFMVGLIKSQYFDRMELTYIREQGKQKGDFPIYIFEVSGNLKLQSASEYAGQFVSTGETPDVSEEIPAGDDGLVAKGREALGLDADRARHAVSGLGH